MGIAMAAIAAAQQQNLLAGLIEIGKQRFLIIPKYLGSDRDAYMDVGRPGTGAIRARAVTALFCAKMLRVAKVDQRIEVGNRLEDDVTTAAAVAAVRAAELDIFFAPEGDDTVTAVARAYIDLGLVKEFHVGRQPSVFGRRAGFPATDDR
jgi:hypothetical protein